MATTVVQSVSANSTGTASPALTLASAPTAGNTLLAVMSSDTIASAVPNAGASRPFTERLNKVDNQGFYLWTRLVASGDSATTTFTISGANPGTFALVEIAGTYDKVGTVASTIGTAGTNRSTTGLAPATTDGRTLAVAGLHNMGSVISAAAVDNGFAILLTQPNSGAGAALGAVIVASVATATTAATGTTTLSWSGNSSDRNGAQIAFSSLAVAVQGRVRRVGKRR